MLFLWFKKTGTFIHLLHLLTVRKRETPFISLKIFYQACNCNFEYNYFLPSILHLLNTSVVLFLNSSFHAFFSGDTATCLYNSPHEDESLPRVLPGKLLTLDAQCRKDRGTSACFVSPDKQTKICSWLSWDFLVNRCFMFAVYSSK